MRMRPLNVSDEYLDSVCERMREWAKKKDSYTIPQFLELEDLSYPFLKYFIYKSNKVMNTFEVVKATLCNRWLDLVMGKGPISPSKAAVLMRFLRLYDSHGMDMETQARGEVASAEIRAEAQYQAENYAGENLKGIHREQYEKNVDKRRGPEAT